jgi:hypothetical protein
MKFDNKRDFIMSILIILGLCIFFLPSIFNYYLPRVNTEEIEQRKIKKTIYLDAELETENNYDITIPKNASVEKFFVRYGQSVGKGVKLFKCSGCYEDERQKLISNFDVVMSENKLFETQKSDIFRKIELNIESINLENRNKERYDLLYQKNAISESDYQNYRSDYFIKVADLESKNAQHRVDLQNINEKLRTNDDLLKKLEESIGIEQSQSLYYKADQDGNYYAVKSGHIVYIDKNRNFKSTGNKILSVAIEESYKDLLLIASVSMDQSKYFNVGDFIEIESDSYEKPFETEVENIGYLADKEGKIKIYMKVVSRPKGNYSIGKSYMGKIEMNIENDNAYAVPMSSFLNQNIEVDSTNYIYLLGKNGFAGSRKIRRVSFRIKELVDEYVLGELSKIDTEDLKEIIVLNSVSHKLKDGKRVMLCN